ncbi:MAG: hypothetical protein QOF43_1329, partial [Gaiellaceae bacterium]|nr:hypothetical protein [Gaiellaceae bacterium]
MSLVSVLMAVWNPHPEWLLQAVRGVLGQQGCEIELVVVDDGCPEPVERLLEPVASERLRVVRVEHGGECRARNAGIAAARGDYIRFADADDLFEPTGTAELLALTGGRDDVIAYGATSFCDEQLQPLWTMKSRVEGDAVVPCLLGAFTIRP